MRYEDLPREEKSRAVLPEQVEFPIGFRLLRPISKDGLDCGEIEMREPTVLDLEMAQREKSDIGRTVALLSHLLELTPAEVRRLGTRDFSRVACLSHHPTVEAHDTTARTSLRLLAVLNVPSSTPARAQRLAPRPDGPLTHFASPRGEKYRLSEVVAAFL